MYSLARPFLFGLDAERAHGIGLKALEQAAGERLRQIVAETPFPIGRGDELKVTMSGGVTTIIPPEDSIEALLKRADDALYRAKSAGRNQIEVDMPGFA